jgi:hypothetical protein
MMGFDSLCAFGRRLDTAAPSSVINEAGFSLMGPRIARRYLRLGDYHFVWGGGDYETQQARDTSKMDV